MKSETFMGLAFLVLCIIIGLFILNMKGLISLSVYDPFSNMNPNIQNPNAAFNQDCTYYNIGQEYRSRFGNDFINTARNNCVAAGGNYFESANELGCDFPDGTFAYDCASQYHAVSRDFCRNDLKDNYICDNVISYAGCVKCGQAHSNAPNPQTPPEPDVPLTCEATCTQNGYGLFIEQMPEYECNIGEYYGYDTEYFPGDCCCYNEPNYNDRCWSDCQDLGFVGGYTPEGRCNDLNFEVWAQIPDCCCYTGGNMNPN